MMILVRFRHWLLGVALAGLAAPAFAAAPADRKAANDGETHAKAPVAGASAQAQNSRRVLLPFDFRPLRSQADAPAPRETTGPHPFRETELKRAALDTPGFRLLSRPVEFG